MSDTRSIKILIDSKDAVQNAEKLRANIEKFEKKLLDLASAGKVNSNEYAKTKKQLDDQIAAQSKYENKMVMS